VLTGVGPGKKTKRLQRNITDNNTGVVPLQVTLFGADAEKPLPGSCHSREQDHCPEQPCRSWPLALGLSGAAGWKSSKHRCQQISQSFAEIKILSQYELLRIL